MEALIVGAIIVCVVIFLAVCISIGSNTNRISKLEDYKGEHSSKGHMVWLQSTSNEQAYTGVKVDKALFALMEHFDIAFEHRSDLTVVKGDKG